VPGSRRHWGWHELDDRWAARLVERSGVGPTDLVLDIGAGTGAITRHLVARGAAVVAFELHPGRVDALRRRFAPDNVRVVCADVTDLRLPRRPFHVVANPPWACTAAILHRLLHPRSRLVGADLVVPVPVAHRWRSGRGPGNRQTASHISVVGHLSSHCFRPPPPQPAAHLRIRR